MTTERSIIIDKVKNPAILAESSRPGGLFSGWVQRLQERLSRRQVECENNNEKYKE